MGLTIQFSECIILVLTCHFKKIVMKNNYLILFILLFIVSSCENFLDVVPEIMFLEIEEVRKLIWQPATPICQDMNIKVSHLGDLWEMKSQLITEIAITM